MDPKALRLARRLRAKANAAEVAARAAEAATGVDQRALAIARRLGENAPSVHRAILAAGLTVDAAAAICGTKVDRLRKAWARGRQFHAAPAKWRRLLARFGVPRDSWPDASQD